MPLETVDFANSTLAVTDKVLGLPLSMDSPRMGGALSTIVMRNFTPTLTLIPLGFAHLSVKDRKLDLLDPAQRLVVRDVAMQANHFPDTIPKEVCADLSGWIR